MIKDAFNAFQDNNYQLPEMDPNEDPFIDQMEPLMIGTAIYKLEPLAYLMDNPTSVSIVSSTSQICGKLEINVSPVDTDGESEVPEDNFPDDPMDLLGQRIDFVVEIKKAIDLPADFCKDVYCEYQFYIDDDKYQTVKILGKN